MSHIQKRNGKYRACYRDPLGRMTSTTFDHKADAERFLAQMETNKHRGAGSTPGPPRCRWLSGPWTSWPLPAGFPRARSRPTGET
jgi:hypothetical protein